jgi:hypothetical protein
MTFATNPSSHMSSAHVAPPVAGPPVTPPVTPPVAPPAARQQMPGVQPVLGHFTASVAVASAVFAAHTIADTCGTSWQYLMEAQHSPFWHGFPTHVFVAAAGVFSVVTAHVCAEHACGT